jgi:hypothetical protein
MGHGTDRAADVYSGADIALGQLETGPPGQVRDIIRPTGREIVQADHAVAPDQQGIAQMRTDKTSATGYNYPHRFPPGNDDTPPHR